MTQYGYANLIAQVKLLERGRVVDGALEVAGRRFTTLATQCEPFPSERLLALLKEFAERGGRLIWSGPPPVLTAEGTDALGPWCDLFGVRYEPGPNEGLIAPGRLVTFEGALAGVQSQMILTDFLVDRIYAVAPLEGTESLSRAGEYLACRFPNGAVTITRHLRDLVEDWPGGFARDREADRKYMEAHPLPPDTLELQDLKLNGHSVTYHGGQALAFRVDADGRLVAFCGAGAQAITIDGRETIYADQPMPLVSWAPVAEERRMPGGAIVQILVHGGGAVRIPAVGLPERLQIIAEGPTPGSRGDVIEARREGEALVIDKPETAKGKWMYVVAQ